MKLAIAKEEARKFGLKPGCLYTFGAFDNEGEIGDGVFLVKPKEVHADITTNTLYLSGDEINSIFEIRPNLMHS